jgi:hypothetical protein
VVFLFVIFALLATGYVLLQHKGIQNKLTDYIMTMMSRNLQTTFVVGEVDLAFPYRLRLKNIYLEDLQKDTLLAAKSLTMGVRNINPFKKVIRLNAVNIYEAYFRLVADSAGTMNIQFLLDKLAGKGDSSKTGWITEFNNIKLKDSRFSLHLYPVKEPVYGINFTNLRLSQLNASLRNFNPKKDSTAFRIKTLSCVEASGFRLEDFKADFSLSKRFLKFYNVTIKTPVSTAFGNSVELYFDSWQDFKEGGFYEKVQLIADLKKSTLNLSDLGYFAPVFKETDQPVTFSAKTKGTIGNLKIKDIDIHFGSTSVIQGEFSINGLPDSREAFIFANFKQLRTSVKDIAAFHLPQDKHIVLPARFYKLGTLTYKGKYTGFLNDFVAFGKFETDLGILSSDLLFKPDTSNYYSFSGKITAQDFDLGSFLEQQKNIGRITMSASARGYSSIQNLKAEIKGLVSSFAVRGYQYKNIELSGTVLNKTYNGSLYINDPNINLDFQGKVDFSSKIGSYNFSANITQANLYALNISKTDPDFRVSFFLQANGIGNNFTDLNGEIRLLNSLFIKKDKQLQVYDFGIISNSTPGNQSLRLRSDFLDADLTGNYDLGKTGNSVKKFLLSYLPSLIDSGGITAGNFSNNFNLSLVFKNTKPIFDFFLPDYYVDESTTLKAAFENDNQEFSLFCQSPRVTLKGLTWNDYHFKVKGDTSGIEFESGGQSLVINDKIRLDNFTVISHAIQDSMDILARWNNWEEVLNKGSIKTNLLFTKPSVGKFPHIAINILPTTIITYDTIWNVNQCEIFIDSSNISIDNLMINHNQELFTLNGKISSKPTDQIDLNFNNFNLHNLNIVTNSRGYQIEGMLNGTASFSSLFTTNPLIISNLLIDSLIINNEKLGTAEILSTWNNKQKSLEIQANARRDKLKTFTVKGNYYLNNRGLDFTISLDKLRLNLFNPYLAKLIDNLRGMASGSLTLNGTIDKPVLNGDINLQKAAFTIKYLQSRYNFSEKIKIDNNNIFFKDIRIFDGYGNKALVNGSLRNKYFRDLTFDVSIQAEDLLFLNTKSKDNRLFYGTAFATGLVKINGSPKNIDMDISAKTEKNTVFNIPLSNKGELNEYNFFTLMKEDTLSDKMILKKEYMVDLSGIRMNFDLEVTPDAEVQIIFDPKVGDIIRGSGTGNLNMKINTSGNFVMFGDFIIEKGDYLFTLQNLINKKFIIDPGGWIRWSGDPFNASIDLTANYRTKASLNELFGTEDQTYQNKTIVDCQFAMTGKLMAPTIRYDINLPMAEEETKISFENVINSSEELNKQFIALLVLNSFVPVQNHTGTAGNSFSTSTYSNVAGVNASELLSNQLSHWLSQISNDFDVGVNYRSDKRMKGDEVEVALSTQLFNDRLSINGSVDVTTNAAVNASNNIVGEFDIDYKLTKNGRFRVKTYNHTNNDLLYENSPYTQGLGFFYKEEFNTLGELLRRYWKAISGKKEENDARIEKESDNKGS